MKNFKMTISFDGSRYKGWQKQKETDLTVQGKIEAVLSKMTGADVLVVGCDRMDPGVHAENYIANFHTKSSFNADAILYYLYEFLPEDIVVKSIELVDDRFHARYNVKSETYVYKINTNKYRNVFERKYSYHINDTLDLIKMRNASQSLIGTHDFQSFTNMKSGNKSTVRTIHSVNIVENGDYLEIEIIGDSFLWNMARIMVGTLLEIGRGKLDPSAVETMLQEKKRWEAGPLAQAKGLFLKEVQY